MLGLRRPRSKCEIDEAYVTLSWTNEMFRRKIEKGVYYRDERGTPLIVVPENHWMAQAERQAA